MSEASWQEADELTLAAEFPAATREQWQRLVAKVVGRASDPGDAPERELVTVTADGIEIEPLYTAEDASAEAGYPGQAPFTRGRTAAGNRGGWDIRQRHHHPDPAAAREQVMEDLEGGVTSLWLGLGDDQIPLGALPDVLGEAYLDMAAIVLDAGAEFTTAAEAFLALAARRGVPASALTGSLGADPLGVLARTGRAASLADAAALAGRCVAELPGMRAIVVDALPCHEAGGTDAQELGYALAAGAEYLRALRGAGMGGPAAAGQLEFRYAATADQFATIAKLRAARRAWARVIELCGIGASAGGQRQHAVTSWPMLTRRDPWNNILRGTLACFAAGVGGAGAITVTPFDAAVGRPDRLGRRVARNTHALLAEESHVASVLDPAGGSWYVEELTGQLAARAWARFQDIERQGGLRAALASGYVAGQLAASRQARRDALARRQEAITGVSEFPLVGESLLGRPPRPQARPPGGLPRVRWAQWHEELRDRADAHARATGSPPTVTLARLDDSRASAAQAGRVAGLLAPTGIATVTMDRGAFHGSALGPAVIVCGDPGEDPGAVRAAVDEARAAGAVTATGADEVLAGDVDVLALGGQLLAALKVA
ncbi:MAG TPA: methylmalonyl-CoA mutase family protein [Trebonia sp.]|jgi:methylmalonyl-CoA mutase|nr:methylmalonyl-CoA mutase family protein [Trebonia sp.]